MKKILTMALALVLIFTVTACSDTTDTADTSDTESEATSEISFTLTDTMQADAYDDEGNVIDLPEEGEAFYGQDAQYTGIATEYTNNEDGTITDMNTGLIWQQEVSDTMSYEDAIEYAENLDVGGYDDWRLPTIKELYSLADFNGELLLDGDSTPYIDTDYFEFEYQDGREYAGQYWSSTVYVVDDGEEDGDGEKAFGFNFADGHIKGYGTGRTVDGESSSDGFAVGMFVRCVRGDENVYGVNDFVDNGDETVTDEATDLMWQQADDGQTRNWEETLSYAADAEIGGYDDWRLPNSKELQSIIDYSKTTIPAVDESFFTISEADSYFWTGTTLGDAKAQACYITFGYGWSIPTGSEDGEYVDYHGAGAQRSDPKSGTVEEYELASENAEDLVRIDNYSLLVRDAN
ncbi:MAG: DUF1566 domain-containing protein [Peptostreptococcaceae bacterium]|nr:DUF1566 domain-containing protein [Peptostreptococcaceae bacterium]